MSTDHAAALTHDSRVPMRTVVQADALAWMRDNSAPADASVITSLPDVSELSLFDLAAWRVWFIDTVRAVIRWLPAGGVAIFYQSDIRSGSTWVDKGYLVMRGAEEEQAPIVWHKIVCRKPPGTLTRGRAAYSHMICIARHAGVKANHPGADVLPDAGFMPWTRAMGVTACRVACEFLLRDTATRLVVDPFCGRGTVLAVANALGLDALGVELGGKRCKVARNLVVEL